MLNRFKIWTLCRITRCLCMVFVELLGVLRIVIKVSFNCITAFLYLVTCRLAISCCVLDFSLKFERIIWRIIYIKYSVGHLIAYTRFVKTDIILAKFRAFFDPRLLRTTHDAQFFTHDTRPKLKLQSEGSNITPHLSYSALLA